MLEQFSIQIISNAINKDELKTIADNGFGYMVKGVVDLEKKIIALGSELHVDEETLLIEQGSKQENLWGINLHPGKPDEEFLEFDSMINIRPSQNNFSRYVESEEVRNKISAIIKSLII